VVHPPAGEARWTLRLLATTLVELGYIEQISHETVRQVLLANELKPWIKKQWGIPTPADAEFVYHMEDVLEVSTRPYDPARPQLCMDEINTQLLADTRESLPMEPGKPKREDYEYEREGVCHVFLACEPLAGKRYTMVAAQRTKHEWAHFIRSLSEESYPNAEKIVLVMDNLNTHTLASLYEVFPVAEARRLAQRFEVHYTRHPCQLAQHGGNRTVGPRPTMLVATLGLPGASCTTGGCLDRSAQSSLGDHQLALHRPGCLYQTETSVPVNQRLTED
jgi:DDE superfamily endonuclease